MADITLTLLTDNDREQFILDNQRAFRYCALEEFGQRDDHFEEDGEIISRKTVENCIDNSTAYRIREDGRIVGGVVLSILHEFATRLRVEQKRRGRVILQSSKALGSIWLSRVFFISFYNNRPLFFSCCT